MAVMQFDEFTQQVDAAVRAEAAIDRLDGQENGTAAGASRSRRAAMALVPPLNVSVTLDGAAARSDVTRYPIDAALVHVVSKRIAAFLSEA